MPHDFRREIDFIVRGPNAGPKLHDEVRSAGPEMLPHCLDGIRDDGQLRAFFSGMDKADRFSSGIGKVNSAAISDVNSEANARSIRDQAVTAFKTGGVAGLVVDKPDPVPVHLLRGNERRGTKPLFSPNFPMNTVQPRECLHFVAGHLDTGHPQGETVNKPGKRTESLELFSRKLTCVHLLPRVVRVVVVVVLV